MSSLHVGKAGQLATMAEFLLRGYNVAIPEVDVGDDIFVVHDRDGTLWRVQVKTAVGQPRGYGFSGRFAVGMKQLTRATIPDLYFVFALRTDAGWEFVILPRALLAQERDGHGVGNISGGLLILNIRFWRAEVKCSGRDWQAHRGNWSPWPVILR